MENLLRNKLVSKNQALRDNALANPLPRKGPQITISNSKFLLYIKAYIIEYIIYTVEKGT
jgi:hypothetical protein